MNKLPISLLIPTMNRPDSLKRTLTSYFSFDYCPSEVIVVDQSSDPNHRRKNKEILDSVCSEANAIYLYQQTPSLTKARNYAVSNANFDIIVFSDDDIDVMSNTLLNTYTLMSKKEVAMVGALDANMNQSNNFLGYLFGFKSFHNRFKGHVTKSVLGRFPLFKKNIQSSETMWAMGFYFAIKKQLITKWELCWDEHLKEYAYAEDLDFSFSYYKKAKAENMNCLMTKDVTVSHLCSPEFRTQSRKATFMYVLHRYYLRKKHKMGACSSFWMNYVNFILLIKRAIKKEKAIDLYDAMKYCSKNKKKVSKGEFYYGD